MQTDHVYDMSPLVSIAHTAGSDVDQDAANAQDKEVTVAAGKSRRTARTRKSRAPRLSYTEALTPSENRVR